MMTVLAERAGASSPIALQLPPGAATDAKLEALRALLAGTLQITLPIGAATDVKLEAVRALLAGTLQIALPPGAASDAKVEAVRALLAGTLSVDQLIRSVVVDRGLVIATANVSTPLMAANPVRRGIMVQNQHPSAFIWFNGLGAATADCHSVMVPPRSTYESPINHVGTGAIAIISDTANVAVAAREF